jgi:hypothetical protein
VTNAVPFEGILHSILCVMSKFFSYPSSSSCYKRVVCVCHAKTISVYLSRDAHLHAIPMKLKMRECFLERDHALLERIIFYYYLLVIKYLRYLLSIIAVEIEYCKKNYPLLYFAFKD